MRKEKEKRAVMAQKSKSAPKIRKLKWKEERELETMEERILDIEENIESIESIFGSTDFYEKYKDKSAELHVELDENKVKVDFLYKRWEELEKIKNGVEL